MVQMYFRWHGVFNQLWSLTTRRVQQQLVYSRNDNANSILYTRYWYWYYNTALYSLLDPKVATITY